MDCRGGNVATSLLRFDHIDLQFCAPGGIRTPNRQIRRSVLIVRCVLADAVWAGQVGCSVWGDLQIPVW